MIANPFTDLEQKLNKLIYMVAELTHLVKELPVQQLDTPINITEAAKYLGMAKATLYSFTSHRQIPHFKRGKKIYFYISDLDKWVREAKQKTTEEIRMEAKLR